MLKVELSQALSSRGRRILRMSVEELLTSLSAALPSMTTGPRHGSFSVPLGKMWVSDGGERTEITVTLRLMVEPKVSPAKQAAVAAAFA
jgi:hypothetical protein